MVISPKKCFRNIFIHIFLRIFLLLRAEARRKLRITFQYKQQQHHPYLNIRCTTLSPIEGMNFCECITFLYGYSLLTDFLFLVFYIYIPSKIRLGTLG